MKRIILIAFILFGYVCSAQMHRKGVGFGGLQAPPITPTGNNSYVYYNSDDNTLYYWNGTTWVGNSADNLGDHTATQDLNLSGFNITSNSDVTMNLTGSNSKFIIPTTKIFQVGGSNDGLSIQSNTLFPTLTVNSPGGLYIQNTLFGSQTTLHIKHSGLSLATTSSSNLKSTLRTNDLTAERIFQFPDADGKFALEADASGFDGNLSTTDNTLQEIAQKVDDLTVSGAGDNLGNHTATQQIQLGTNKLNSSHGYLQFTGAPNTATLSTYADTAQIKLFGEGFVYGALTANGGFYFQKRVAVSANQNLTNSGNILADNLTGIRNYQFPDVSGTFALEVDASGFNGNLANTDNTLQEIADKVDDLVLSSGSTINQNRFVCTSNNSTIINESILAPITLDTYTNTVNTGSLITFNGTNIVVNATTKDVELEAFLKTNGEHLINRKFYFRDRSDSINTAFGDGNVTNGVSSYGTYGKGSSSIKATAIVRAGTTVTLNLISQTSYGNQRIQEGSYIQAKEIN